MVLTLFLDVPVARPSRSLAVFEAAVTVWTFFAALLLLVFFF